MSLFTELQSILSGIVMHPALKERLALFENKLSEASEYIRCMEEELAHLRAVTVELRQQIKNREMAEQYTEHKGALFKLDPSGGITETVICIDCRSPMASFGKAANYKCSKCGFQADFAGHELPRILNEVKAKLSR